MPAYKDEERNTWYVSFSYKDWDGQNKRKLKRGFRTKKDALAFEREFISKKTGKDLTMDSLLDLMLEDRKTQVKPTTYHRYEYYSNLYIRPYLGNKMVNDITINDIRKWHSEMIEKGLHKKSLQLMHTIVSMAFNFGIKFYGIQQNPAAMIGSPKMSTEKKEELKFWTYEQYRTFLTGIRSRRNIMLFDALYYSGMRIGEALALKWNDVDWEGKTLRVDETYSIVKGVHFCQPPKTKSSYRTVPMPDFFMENLKEYKKRIYECKEDDRIFFWVNSHSVVRINMKRAIDRSGVPFITVHDLRHSHASLLIDMGMPILLVSERLGHEDPSITLKVYSHLFPTRQDEFISKLNNMYQNCITDKS